jgi:hypothetical protein
MGAGSGTGKDQFRRSSCYEVQLDDSVDTELATLRVRLHSLCSGKDSTLES